MSISKYFTDVNGEVQSGISQPHFVDNFLGLAVFKQFIPAERNRKVGIATPGTWFSVPRGKD